MHALEAAATALDITATDLLGNCTLFVHGSTVATNTVLEGKGAKVGLLTTTGFRDTLEIRRGMRDDPWDHRTPFAPVLVPRHLRLPVAGRLDKSGTELEAPDLDTLDTALAAFKQAGVESIAVTLFNSYASATHETTYADALRERAAVEWVSASHHVAPLIGEYERTATTVLNAYIAPRTVGYLRSLDERLQALGLTQPMLLIQNNGGSVSATQVANKPATLLLSGPAAGVGALEIARQALGTDNLLSLEIGGTSADVMLMENGTVPVSDQLRVGGYDTALPSVDIHTIGAGGGTIASVDEAGLLQVGPQGAGAVPGPAAYGLGGTLATVTDALLVLGRLKPGPYAGGAVVLDATRAREAISTHVAEPLQLSAEAAATGIVRLLEQNLLQALERMTLERGVDPRTFTLIPAGGAGPMHGASVGRKLGCSNLYIPRLSGAFCALGMLNVDVRHDLMRTFFHSLDRAHAAGLTDVLAQLAKEGHDLLLREGFASSQIRIEAELDLRYIGQQWSIRTAMDVEDSAAVIRSRFEQIHESRYRHIQPDGVVEITAVNTIAYGIIDKLQLLTETPVTATPQRLGTRRIYMDEMHGWTDADVYDGKALTTGMRISGPAIIEESTTTACIGPDDQLTVDKYGNFVVQL
jgi:N-methylhydantoinase A